MRYISEMEEAFNEHPMAVSLGEYDLSRQPRIWDNTFTSKESRT